MKIVRALALIPFAHVIMGQQYHGDPDHPDEDGRKPRVKEEHVEELERLGYISPIETREVVKGEDDDDADAPKNEDGPKGATILGEQPGLDNALSNPGGDGVRFNPNPQDLGVDEQSGQAGADNDKPQGEGEGHRQEGGEGERQPGGEGEGDADNTGLILPTDIGESVALVYDDNHSATLKFVGGGWYEIAGTDEDGTPASKKIRKADAEKLLTEYNDFKAKAAEDPDAAPLE